MSGPSIAPIVFSPLRIGRVFTPPTKIPPSSAVKPSASLTSGVKKPLHLLENPLVYKSTRVLHRPAFKSIEDIPDDEPVAPSRQQKHMHTQEEQSLVLSAAGQKKSYTRDDFDIGRTIGKGGGGRVFLAQSKTDAQVYALKVVRKTKLSWRKLVERQVDEAILLRYATKSPFVVGLFATFQDSHNLYFLMELVQGGDLWAYMFRCGVLKVRTAKACFSEVTIALQYIHSIGIIYRDLKPENILIAADGHIRLADFGFAVFGDRAYSFVGTPTYHAPEVVSERRRPDGYTNAIDWYAAGVLLYEMLCGGSPFPYSPKRDSIGKLYDQILDGDVVWDEAAKTVPRDLVEGLMALDPDTRLDGDALKRHRWFEDVDWAKVERRVAAPPFAPMDYSGPTDSKEFASIREDSRFWDRSDAVEQAHAALYADFDYVAA